MSNIFDIFILFGTFGLVYIVPYSLYCFILMMIFRKRIVWCVFDLATLFVPFLIWTLLFNHKTPTNGVIEPFILSMCAIILISIRFVIGKKIRKQIISFILLSILCLITIVVSLSIPPLTI